VVRFLQAYETGTRDPTLLPKLGYRCRLHRKEMPGATDSPLSLVGSASLFTAAVDILAIARGARARHEPNGQRRFQKTDFGVKIMNWNSKHWATEAW
jgi:hypothetical protein